MNWPLSTACETQSLKHTQVAPAPISRRRRGVLHWYFVLIHFQGALFAYWLCRDLKRKKVVVSWAYAASYSKPISVPQSLILQMTRFGCDVVLAHPPEFKLMPDIMQQAQDNAKKYGFVMPGQSAGSIPAVNQQTP
mgnify:CR=1 FL=1